MSLQRQSDVGFINNIFAQEGRKTLDVFKLGRLDKAIKALERNDPSQGAAARADYYTYNNQSELAFATLDKAIKQYGYSQMLGRVQVRTAKSIGNWLLIKKYTERLLMTKDFELRLPDLSNYIEDSAMHLDNSNDFIKILQLHDVKEYERIYSDIESKRDWYLKQGGDLSVYRKVLEITIKTIKSKYSLPLEMEFRTQSLQLIVSNSYWSLEETAELTKEINNAILEQEDLDFQLAADDIEVFCINFSIDKLPKDFVYYEDNDNDLIEIIETRMANNSSPEKDGEELYV